VSAGVVPGSYRSLVAVAGAPRLLLFALVGRIPIGMLSLGIVLMLHAQTGSFATAGGVAAAFAIGGGFAAPVQGRLVDRLGQTAVLVPSGVVNAVAVAGLVAAATGSAPIGVVYALGALVGASIPPLSACMRALWATLLADGQRLESAYALEAVSTEAFFVLGPLLTAALVALASPAAALLTAGGLALIGSLGFAGSAISRGWRSAERDGSRMGALGSPGMRTLVAAVLPSAIAFGTLEIALPAFADEHGSAATGGVLLSALAIGSMAGGLWYGTRRWKAPLERRYLQLSAVFAAGLVLPPLAHSLPVIAILMVIAGLALAPIVTLCYSLIDRLAPAGTSTEAYMWVITANVAGTAVGTAVAGAVAQAHDANTALFLAGAGAALGFLVALARRRTLRVVSG
jgi:MFS family permease